ncbi:MAG: protoheme IX farnesyltransferase, partial [Daejeonella sp.]
MMSFISDFNKLIKLRLTFTVVFSASVSFLIGSKVQG